MTIDPLNINDTVSSTPETLNSPGIRKYPNLAQFSKASKKQFVDFMDQFLDDDPGITIDGKYYPDQGDTSALMAMNDYLQDNQNITSNFTKLNDMERDIEKQIERLIG